MQSVYACGPETAAGCADGVRDRAALAVLPQAPTAVASAAAAASAGSGRRWRDRAGRWLGVILGLEVAGGVSMVMLLLGVDLT